MKKHLVAISIAFIIAITLFNDFNKRIWQDPHRVIQWDVIDYYGYLPAAFIYHDLNLTFLDHYKGKHHFIFWAKKLPNGHRVFKMTMGVSVMLSPFFFAAHLLAGPLGYDTGGYSLPYRFAIVMAGWVYLFLGLLVLSRVLRFYFSRKTIAVVLLTTGLGTNLFWYATEEPGMSHVYTFFLASAFLYVTILWHKKNTVSRAALLGIAIGLLTLIRPVNMLMILFFLFYEVKNWRDVQNKALLFRKKFSHLALMALSGFLMLLPQFLYWKSVTGHWVYYSYGNEGFFFLHPQILNVLFSFRKGWFVYTPVMIFAVSGIYFLYKKYKPFFLPVLSLLLVYLYVVSSWWCWWYGGSLGQRELIDIYPFMAIPLAAFVEVLRQSRKRFVYPLRLAFVFSVLLGGFYNIQYHYGAIHWDSMTRAAWFDSFGRIHPSPRFQQLISPPDYDNALLGLPERKTSKPLQKKENLENIIRRIRSDKKWYEIIKQKAAKKNIPVDSMLQLDARYVLDHRK